MSSQEEHPRQNAAESATRDVRVNLGPRAYDIQIGHRNLRSIGRFVTDRIDLTHAIVITDENVQPLYGSTVRSQLAETGARVDLLEVAPGEGSKSAEQANRLWQDLLEAGADRKSIVVAVGGGVVGDLAGFVAATYGRGIGLVQVPTTLLAQVDSSVGGKVGINLPAAKNMVGAFWQPRGVLIDIDVLSTLPDREYRAGLAEVVKYGVILDEPFFRYLQQHVEALNQRDANVLTNVVARCCQLKADVVEADETEQSGRRAVLNYGHTFCHAIEAVTGYAEFLHGEAVSIGMLCASRLAERLGRVDSQLTSQQHELLSSLGLPVTLPQLDHDQLIAAMQRDKKTQHGQLRFVLPSKMGHVELVANIDSDLVRAALSE